MMSASQAILRRVVAFTGPVKTKFPVPVPVSVVFPGPLLVPGLVFGYFRERYNALWPAIVLHVWYNAGFFLSGALLAF